MVDNRDAERYEVWTDGELAGFTAYRLRPRRITLLHTEILPGHVGEGLGRRLASAALADARARGLALLPVCPFIAGYIRAHPELLEAVVPSLRRRLGAAARSEAASERRDPPGAGERRNPPGAPGAPG